MRSVPKQKNRNFSDDTNTACRRAEGQKAEEEERLRELGYSVAGQKIRKKSVADFKKYCGRLWQDLDLVYSRLT